MSEDVLHIRPKGLRTLAPAGGFPTPLAITNACRTLRQLASAHDTAAHDLRQTFRQFLKKRFSTKTCEFYGSGTEALYRVFAALRTSGEKRAVAMAAYTCPSIASAAARAGLRIVPVDIDDKTLEIKHEGTDPKDLCAIVCSNLYGLVDAIAPCQELSMASDMVVIDDACQSAFSSDASSTLGARPKTVGILSFGRGKAINGIGGGAVLLNDSRLLPNKEDWMGQTPDFVTSLTQWGMASIVSLLEHPLLFGVPARLPFLGLGQTHCEIDFTLRPVSDLQLCVAFAQFESEAQTKQVHARNLKLWLEALSDQDVVLPFKERARSGNSNAIPLRLPVLFKDKTTRDRTWKRLAEAGLGASISYPKPLQDYVELKGFIVPTETNGARRVAETIITLPVHRHVQLKDIERSAKIIKEENR